MKIAEVYLFTNRNSIFFDEKGEQIADLQKTISWDPVKSYEDYKVEATLKRIIEDNPKLCIAKWQGWSHELTVDEFCCLVGFGPWYWDYKNSRLEESV